MNVVQKLFLLSHHAVRSAIIIMSSALLYVISLYSTGGWILTGAWVVPLWYVFVRESREKRRLQSWCGLLWGIIAFGGNMGGMLLGFYYMASGSWLCRLLVPLCMLLYQSCLSMLWFFGTSLLLKVLDQKVDLLLAYFLCAGTTWLYSMFVYQFSFLLGGACEGHPFFNPLLSLVHAPALLGLLPTCGIKGMLALLYGTWAACISVVISFQARTVCIASCCCLVWLISFQQGNKSHFIEQLPSWVASLAVIPVQFPAYYTVDETIECISMICEDLLIARPQVQSVIFPESSIYRVNCISQEHIALAEESESDVLKGISLIIGGFRSANGICYNSIWWLYEGAIVDVCDKRHLLCFSEKMPSLFNMSFLRDLFFKTCDELVESTAAHTVWEITPALRGIIYICSELFCAYAPRDTYNNSVIIALCNDSWAPAVTRRQMLQAAAFRAIEWNRDILYVTHTYVHYFTRRGQDIDLSGNLFHF